MKLLLHICCAPCSIYPFQELIRSQDNQVQGFYFNPNIHPREEYLKRRSAVEKYSKDIKLEVTYPVYEPEYFFTRIEDNDQKPTRCKICWRMRLEAASLFARGNGFDAFSTTLLISPYQDHLVIKKIGEELEKGSGVKFYYQDFRPGFRQSQDQARGHNLYRQKYCGCKYSLSESQMATPACRQAGIKKCR